MAVEMAETAKRVAIFGGSFNPPHQGHVLAAVHVLSTGQVDEVLVVPVFEHALSKQLIDFESRFRMAEAAFGWLPHVRVSAIESTLPAPSRTLTTLRALRAERPGWEMRLMIGSDILSELPRWHAFEEIQQLAPPLVLARAGDEAAARRHCVLPEVSSTEVRQLLRKRASLGRAAQETLRDLVPAKVLRWIDDQHLYT